MPVLHRRGLATALTVLLFGLVLAVGVYDLPGIRPVPTFVVPVDGWLQGACFVTAAALCLLRASLRDEDAWLWGWIGAALTARALGFVLFFSWVRFQVPLPYPSVSDYLWLLTVVFMMVGLVLLARSRFHLLSLGLALDAVSGACAAAALSVLLLWDTLVARAAVPADHSVVVTNLAYPVLDVMLLLVLTGVLAAYSWRPPLSVWALMVGVVGFVVTDWIFLAEVTAGTFHPGTLLGPFTLLTNAVIAAAGWLPSTTSRDVRRDLLPGLLLPGLFALVSLTVLILASRYDVPATAVVLAGLGVATAFVRTGLTFRTVRQAAEHRREARTDDLTGLANRRAFNEEIAARLHRRSADEPLALLLADLDNFKVVNDTLGHHNGDELLRQVAARLLDGLRAEDLLARIGGDEFAVLLDAADAELAEQVAERLRVGLRRPFAVASRNLDVSASIGIAMYPFDGQSGLDLLQRADLAMYEAKATRTGHSVFRPEPHQENLARLESVERIRRAIDEDEIVLHYQPVVSLATGEVVGAEALCRWQHPTTGLVPPAGFLPLAESGGLMRLLTLNVLEQAIRQATAWRADGHRLTVAVNMSVTNLLDVAFPEQLAMLLEEEGLPGDALELELTEDLFLTDPARARRVIHDLLETGVRLVVDDYGTGYSSLAYLRDLHEISGLKLDRSFVTHLADDHRAAAIVESTVAMAGSLGLKVIAEGVETEVVRDRLAALGCELAQGFLFSRPVPPELLRFGVIGDAQASPA